jgi:hypothetical protein
MTGLLVRVGADQSEGGGYWNGPVDSTTNEFVYVSIPEQRPCHKGLEKLYSFLDSHLVRLGTSLPMHLRKRCMHLDPDFDHLTHGDKNQRAKQIGTQLVKGDFIVFYAELKDLRTRHLVYAIIGFYKVKRIVPASSIARRYRDVNAHTRRILSQESNDIVVFATPSKSGRLKHYLPIGNYRNRAYRVRNDLLESWGGLSVRGGYIQRSAQLPRFLRPKQFLKWYYSVSPKLVHSNN